MSLPRETFEGESEHALQEFTCAVCLSVPLLNEACVSTKTCQHVFCSNCLGEWKRKNHANCPTCNRQMNPDEYNRVLSLKDTSPLGFRILGRLRIRCTLKDCSWRGDFSELDAHLLNSDNHKEKNNAGTLKDMGNERFTAGRFDEALKLYEKALTTTSDPTMCGILHSNRAAALLKLGRPLQAAEACDKASVSGSKDVKVFVRWSQALTQLGRFNDSVQVLDQAIRSGVPGLASHKTQAQTLSESWESSARAIEQSDWEQARAKMAPILQDANARLYSRAVSRAALIEAHVGDLDMALRLSLEAARSSPDDEQAWIARAYALVSNGQFEEALKSAKQALRLNPDENNAKNCARFVKSLETQVQAARTAADKKDFTSARTLFLELVQGTTLPKNSPLRVQLLAERAHACFNAGLYQEALKDATSAIYQQDDCQRAWLTRLYCLRELGKHDEAVKDARELLNRWGANDLLIRNAAEKAEFELRKSKRPDLYGVLGVSSLASEMEIKQAYKQKALVFHPDKIGPSATEEERKRCEESFKLMGIALDMLGNIEKRELWDKGFDIQGVQEELDRRRRRSSHGH